MQDCARLNAAKLHMNWRSVMRNAKAEELRGAVSALAQRFECAIDRRDLLIQARIPPAGPRLDVRASHTSGLLRLLMFRDVSMRLHTQHHSLR